MNIFDIVQETYNASSVPWVVTYSGGKDSSVILDLVFKAMLNNKKGQHVYIISNDTKVESPLVINHLKEMHATLDFFIKKERLNASIHMTKPNVNNSFWVNLIGRGYPAPSQMFRWCTSRLKIDPTSDFIKNKIKNDKILMLIGTREDESNARKKSIKKNTNDDSFYSQHHDLKKCKIFMPIRYMTTQEVWNYLSNTSPPWGGSYIDLISLYKDAYGGECPLVIDTSQLKKPSCGERSPRFGCWTCTLVKDDSSLRGLIESGHHDLKPLYDFRNWLVNQRNISNNRHPYSKNGRLRYKNGRLIYGSYKIRFRMEILDYLLKIQHQVGYKLIDDNEIRAIRKLWEKDAIMEKMFAGNKVNRYKGDDSEAVLCEVTYG